MAPVLADQLLAGVEGLELGFGLFDPTLKLIVCNKQFGKLRDLPEDLCQPGTELRTLLNFSAKRGDYDLSEVEARLEDVKSAGSRSIEQTMADGTILAIRYAQLDDGCILLTYQDISELRAAELAARESEQRHAMVTEAATEGLYDWNVSDNVLYVSPRLNRILGFEEGTLNSEAWAERVHADDRALYADAMRAHFRGEIDRMNVEYRILTTENENRWVHDSAVAVRNDDGWAVRLVGAVSDITEQKNAEEALRQNEERHVLALEAVGETVYDWDVSGDEVYYSDGIYRILGLERHELRTTHDWLNRIHEDDKETYLNGFRELFQDKAETFSIEYRFKGVGDEWRWASQHGIAVRDDSGRILRITGSTGDITERREMANNLQQAQERLLEAERLASLGQVTAGVAHEIKNPLNFVNNFAQLSTGLVQELTDLVDPLIDKLPDDDREDAKDIIGLLQENLSKIDEHGRRADGIVQSMLAHSRESSGERQEIDINKLADEALNLAYHGARAENQAFNVTLVRELDDRAGRIVGQPQELMRVFLNLAGNAIHATHKRSEETGSGDYEPTITLRSEDQGDSVEIRLRDNGTGMPDTVKEKIFEPFFTTKPTGQGTGLGLSISFDIVVQGHGGEMTVESREGEYTEFAVTLPR
jgi:PAS domain S-box-containing protein